MGLTAVEPGLRDIELKSEDGRSLVRRKVSVEAGDTLAVEDLFEPHHSRLMVGMGVGLRTGPGLDALHPVVGEIELSWLDPLRTPAWLRLEGHLRLNLAQGTVPDQRDVGVAGGANAAGLSAGLRKGPLSIGPEIDLVQTWRAYEDMTGPHSQSALSAAPGARLLLTLPLGGRELALRADSRYLPMQINDARSHVWQHGVVIGLTGRR